MIQYNTFQQHFFKRMKSPTLDHTSNLQALQFKTTKIIDNRYKIKDKCLGNGSYAKVYICWDRDTQKTIAAKEIAKELILSKINLSNRRQNCRDFYIKSLQNESKITQKLNHPNILKMFGHAETHANIYFFLEYCNQPDLAQLLNRHSKLSYHTALPIIRKIVKGCVYLHSLGIAHRDLKPENILMDSGQPKICDFGFAVKLQNEKQGSLLSQYAVGTEAYMAPQVHQSQILSLKSDVWSLGITFYKMLTGRLPFDGSKRSASRFQSHSSKHLWEQSDGSIPNFLKAVIEKMLTDNYKARPSIHTIQGLLKM